MMNQINKKILISFFAYISISLSSLIAFEDYSTDYDDCYQDTFIQSFSEEDIIDKQGSNITFRFSVYLPNYSTAAVFNLKCTVNDKTEDFTVTLTHGIATGGKPGFNTRETFPVTVPAIPNSIYSCKMTMDNLKITSLINNPDQDKPPIRVINQVNITIEMGIDPPNSFSTGRKHLELSGRGGDLLSQPKNSPLIASIPFEIR